MNEKTLTVSRLDATYVAPIVPQFADLKEAFLAEAYKPYFRALQAAADTHLLVLVPIPETFRIEKGNPTVDYVTIDVRGTGSPMRAVNPEFALLTVGSGAGLKLIDKVAGIAYDVLGKTGRQIAKSMLAGEASNLVLEGITGKTYGENLRSAAGLITSKVVSENTPETVKSLISEGLNPFYYGFLHNSPFIQQLIHNTTGPHKAGIIPTARLAYHLNFDKPIFQKEPLLNVGWAPKQTIAVKHLSHSPLGSFRLFNPELWGAGETNPFGVWFSPLLTVGIPRTRPGKAIRSARARAVFNSRPYEIQGDLTLNKPIVTIGEVPNRAALEYAAERAGADGVIYNNIYDNGYNATTSIKSFVDPVITNIIERQRPLYRNLISQFGGNYTFGTGDVIHTRALSLKALNFLKQIYESPLYRERVINAYPLWSTLRVDAFINGQIARTEQALKKLTYNKSTALLGKTGNTTILNTSTAQEPTNIEVAYDVDDPFLVALHEGLHFSSLGGRAPNGYYLNPDALAIVTNNLRFTPTLKRSYYKLYSEAVDPVKVKEQYIADMREKWPYLSDELLEEMFFNKIIKEGLYYNTDDELRSFGLAELLQGYYKGEIQNPNDPKLVYEWLIRKYRDKTMSDKLRHIMEAYRPNFAEWAKYLAKALSIGTIPLMQNTKENERLGKTKMD